VLIWHVASRREACLLPAPPAAHLTDASRQTTTGINQTRIAARSVAGQMGEAEARRAGQVSDVDGGWLIAASVVSRAQGEQAGEGCAASAVARRIANATLRLASITHAE
jgi:hypothetical protein